LFYVSFAGLGIGLGLEIAGPGLVTAGLDYNTAYSKRSRRVLVAFSFYNQRKPETVRDP